MVPTLPEVMTIGEFDFCAASHLSVSTQKVRQTEKIKEKLTEQQGHSLRHNITDKSLLKCHAMKMHTAIIYPSITTNCDL